MDAPRGIRLTLLPAHDCSYLPGRPARMRGFVCRAMAGSVYRELMDRGFRRSGVLVYQPACVGCAECRSLRISVEGFKRSASQRRCWKKNSDLVVTVAKAQATEEKFQLYARYLRDWHGRSEETTWDDFVAFLYESPVETIEMEYRDHAGRLLAVGICDRVERALSSVYFYFDPQELRRGLGTFGVLWEIEFARREGLTHYYLGYWVADCDTMQYKATFGPHEVLDADGTWRSACEISRS